MSTTISPSQLRRRACSTELQLALATPVARMLLIGSVVMAVIFCSANLAVVDDLSEDGITQLGLHAASVPTLLFSLLAGAYSASTDRRFGFIEQRLLSDGSRSRWLLSKAVTQGLVGLLYGVLGVVTAIATCMVVFSVRGASFNATSPDAIKALVGVMFAAPLLSGLGVLVGSLVSNTPAVIAGILVWSLVIEPPIILGLPVVGRWLPVAGALALTNTPNPDLATQWAGALSLTAYAIIASTVIGRRLERIDV